MKMLQRLISSILAFAIHIFIAPGHANHYRWGGGRFVNAVVSSKTALGLFYARTDVGSAYRWDKAMSRWTPLTDWVMIFLFSVFISRGFPFLKWSAIVLLSATTLLSGCGGAGRSSSVNVSSSSTSSVEFGVGSSEAASKFSSSASSQPLATACDFPSKFSWVSSGPLILPASADHVSIKDPTVVYYNDQYHIFATVFDISRNGWGSVYLNFSDFSTAASAPQITLEDKPTGNAVAPQVFYFRPHNSWYLIYQWGAKYSTNSDISNPDTWTAPQSLLANGLDVGLDYWVICDDANCHLFFSGDDGNLYRSKTPIDNFPNFSGYEIVMSDEVGKLFEASNVYKVDGKDMYLLLVEAYGPRYFRSWTATSLDGPWIPLADIQSAPFAGAANVSFEGEKWTSDISHGEIIRSGYDETLVINPCDMQFLYQGVDPNSTASYTDLPYRLGLLKQSDN